MSHAHASRLADAALRDATAAYSAWQRAAALKLIAAGAYERLAGSTYKIRSSKGNGAPVWYLTDPSQCTCAAGSYTPDSSEPGLCKHRCAVTMLVTGQQAGILPPGLLTVPDLASRQAWDMSEWPPEDVTVGGVVAALEASGVDDDRVQLVTGDGTPLTFAGVTATSNPDIVWVVVAPASTLESAT